MYGVCNVKKENKRTKESECGGPAATGSASRIEEDAGGRGRGFKTCETPGPGASLADDIAPPTASYRAGKNTAHITGIPEAVTPPPMKTGSQRDHRRQSITTLFLFTKKKHKSKDTTITLPLNDLYPNTHIYISTNTYPKQEDNTGSVYRLNFSLPNSSLSNRCT